MEPSLIPAQAFAESGRALLGSIAGVLALTATMPYLISIVRGRTLPSLASYLVWAAIECVGAASLIATLGPQPATWPRLAFAAGAVLIVLFCLRRQRHAPWTVVESGTLLITGMSCLAWILFDAPGVALIVSAIASAAAYTATLRKTWRLPGTEDRSAWALTCAASWTNLTLVPAIVSLAALPIIISVLGSTSVTLVTFSTRPRHPHPDPEGS